MSTTTLSESDRRAVIIIRDYSKPVLSIIGFILFAITLSIHLCFRFIRISDVGIGMLMSLANALFLVFTLLWSVAGIIEFWILLKTFKDIKNKLVTGTIVEAEYKHELKRCKVNISISLGYISIILCQLGYVISNWDEVNI